MIFDLWMNVCHSVEKRFPFVALLCCVQWGFRGACVRLFVNVSMFGNTLLYFSRRCDPKSVAHRSVFQCNLIFILIHLTPAGFFNTFLVFKVSTFSGFIHRRT